MKISHIIEDVKRSLDSQGVYRTTAQLLQWANDCNKLIAGLVLYDERLASININGTRNFCALPTSNGATCLAPLYVTNSHSGTRVHPTKLDDFHFSAELWEGVVATQDAEMYMLFCPVHPAFASLLVNPIQNIGRSQFVIVGAFIPPDLTADQTSRLPEEFTDLLFRYMRFMAFVGEPGRGTDATAEIKLYIQRLNELVVRVKARFPGGRDYEPMPVEVNYGYTTEGQKTVPESTTEPEVK